MDRVRLGRALGYGARHAVKTVFQAADAVRSPSATPTRPASPARSRTVNAAQPSVQASSKLSPRRAAPLGRSLWAPLARFTSVVWLQVTGLFFALIALFLFQGVWQQRAAWRMPPGSHAAEKLYLLSAACLAFAYFAVSSFVRASRRDRR
ncbi:MAG: hypothetical protein ACP5E5_12460 [Acidobacteriaceae bacterium]